jgi:hypothetical protein
LQTLNEMLNESQQIAGAADLGALRFLPGFVEVARESCEVGFAVPDQAGQAGPPALEPVGNSG